MLNLSTEPKFCMCEAHQWKLMWFIYILHLIFVYSSFLVKSFSPHCQVSMACVIHACV